MSSLAPKLILSKSLSESRKRVLQQYRKWQRSVPNIVFMYNLDIPILALRHKVREQFEKNRNIDQLKLVNLLVFKGEQEYEETMNKWKQREQLMYYFTEEHLSQLEFHHKNPNLLGAGFLKEFYLRKE